MNKQIIGGLDFAIKELEPEDIYTPADFTDEHKMIAETTRDFVENEVVPVSSKIESLDYELTRKLLKKAGELGLLGAEIDEAYGGVGLDKVSAMIIAEKFARGGSLAVTYSVHSGLATLPIVYYGSEDQKKKYLPKFSTGEFLGAFALTEAEAGSDPMAGKTKAVLSEDGTYYLLNGEKMWISNAGFADIFILFAKVDEKFTAFIVEKDFGGIVPGLEEKKLGIKGSSTTALCIDNVKVPVENLLGGVGNGFKIALGTLNVGRIKVGAVCIGSCKVAINDSIQYANERKQFRKPIATLGAIKEKIGRMIINTYVGESIIYRATGDIDALLKNADNNEGLIKGLGEFAAECAICKVKGSEFLDYVVDEAVQIHGGYGYSSDYPIERYYRDSRINRIFEGTNEINRLVISSMFVRKITKEKENYTRLSEEIIKNLEKQENAKSEFLSDELLMIDNVKKALLVMIIEAMNKWPDNLLRQQEILFRISDILMELYSCESVIARVIKEGIAQDGFIAAMVAKTYCHDAGFAVYKMLLEILTEIHEQGDMPSYLTIFNKLLILPYSKIIQQVRTIAEKGIEENKYPL
ncbi:MAG: hypothetical protein A2Y62_20535 [Candidatus Fischerbacteria bacterium RBG_13_37_8]|uniref:Acyl-CoA dehydrogenase n=1 Tax=Candidatus Fischerbacteria bacterium RBG_13_37_8 TaxID=1817863 RepID=A0A1F5VEE8_9BACT|nr:MAG: hypothetical protein A2Y62_20535 [Candidatus Fischerbacteria bacterium RBG_13_37_8]